MHKYPLSINLPLPWKGGTFSCQTVGHINYLVGPNGSGKSRFAQRLASALPNARLLGTDRLFGMEAAQKLKQTFGDHTSDGLPKNHFDYYKAARQDGIGIDAIILLEERPDLRIQVEATLSQLFGRRIRLEWDSGSLKAMSTIDRTGDSYRLDRDECHGIKELFVLLTHLYNDEHSYLIIDEPELNLHPQFQAFFMQEVRRIAGEPVSESNKKVIFLITHSPFILDFRSVDDVRSVISFSSDHSEPQQILDIDEPEAARLSSLVPRLNVHHKQLFFADSPIFVEGILDARLLNGIQECRGVSIAGAGSCIIDAGGCEEVNKYLTLCLKLGKKAHFVYDLDTLFSGNLRQCLKGDEDVKGFLAAAGVGPNFARYCGELDSSLMKAITDIQASTVAGEVGRLRDYLGELGPRGDWSTDAVAKARVALLTALSCWPAEMSTVLDKDHVAGIRGRMDKIVAALREKNIHLLPGGTLERYLPSYVGHPYKLEESQKRAAVEDELTFLSHPHDEAALEDRYSELYSVSTALPSKLQVDIDTVLREYASSYIHQLQRLVAGQRAADLEAIRLQIERDEPSLSKVFSVRSLDIQNAEKFLIEVEVKPLLGGPKRLIRITPETNAGMGKFELSTLP